ncbi:MAG: adenylosuccinate synthase [Clostridia bacterium]|nr:adenylosuccinate synthase [Clostridia bacterium]
MEQKKLDVVLGLQWGDEGKGKIVDVLTPSYKMVARFQGGPNAGHSLVFGGDSFVLHTVPSGIFREGTENVIGNNVVIDPVILMNEISKIENRGVDINGRLVISKRAHLIMPTHIAMDAASESAMGKSKIGSTHRGIGPTYADKTGRYGLRVGDILQDNFKALYEERKQRHQLLIGQYPPFELPFNFDEYEKKWFQAVEQMKRFPFIDSEVYVNAALEKGVPILAEGAQGSLLDIDFGTYPYVTSSNTLSAGVCTGLGIAPSRVGKVYGIFKAYCTRVGTGPFPTELFDETGESLRQNGHEFGATTGRPRRCGWLDLPALKYAVMLSGVTDLMMMKSDVMDDFATLKVATAYRYNGQETKQLPFAACTETMEPVYTEIPGWQQKIEGKIPQKLEEYIQFIENYVGVPIKFVSYGPDRTQNIYR